MKKRQMSLVGILFSAMFILTGCGTPLHEMTEEERDIVVHYAAYVVGKHNIYQKDGMTNADLDSWLEAEEDLFQEQAGETAGLNGGSSSEDSLTPDGQQRETITLAEALGQKQKLTVKYRGCTSSESYQEGGYYALTSMDGKNFLIMNFTIQNIYYKAIKIDALTKNPMYAISINGGAEVQAKQTFLTYSLSTFQGKIESGKKVDLVLLFEVPKEQTEKMKNVSLTLVQNNVSYLVEL